MISPEALLVVGIGALLVFGPRKLPELGRSLGQGIREFRSGTQGLKEELEQSMHAPAQPAAPAPTLPAASTLVAAPLTSMSTQSTLPARPAEQDS